MNINKTAKDKVGYYRIYDKTKKRTVFYHRHVWEKVNGEIPKGMEIDHINGNTLDNRIENLRMVSHKDNHKNKKHHKMRGIIIRKKTKGFSYEVFLSERVNGIRKVIYSKRHPNLKEALIDRDRVFIHNGYTIHRL